MNQVFESKRIWKLEFGEEMRMTRQKWPILEHI